MGDIYAENLASHNYVVGKDGSILIDFQIIVRTLFFDTSSKLKKYRFLKVSCSTEPETISVNFSDFVTLKSLGPLVL